MIKYLKNSIFVRFILWIAECSQYCFFAQIGRVFLLSWENSSLRRFAVKLIERPDPTESSVYGKFTNSVGKISESICLWFGNAFENGVVGRLCRVVRKAALNSRLMGWAARIGLRRWAIIVLALYAAVDWFLRDVVKIGVLSSVWDEALFLGLAAFAFALRGSRPQIYRQRASALESYIVLFCAAGFFLMCAVSPVMSVAISGYRAVVQYILWFFVIIRLFGDESDFSLFYRGILLLSLLMCAHGIYQFIVAAPIPSSWVTSTESAIRTRVFSITGSPNIFGSFIVMTAPIAAGMMYSAKKIKQKAAWLAALTVMCLTLLFTFSRGAWLGAAVAVVIFALLVDGRLLALLGGVIASVLVFIPSVTNRIIYLFTPEFRAASNAGGRSMRWTAGFKILNTENPVLGFGLGRFGGAVAMQNQTLESVAGYKYFYLDNYYLKTLVEMGYMGLFFYILLLLGFAVWGIRAVFRTKGKSDYPVMAGIFAGLCGVLIHCFFENIFEVPYMQAYFWMLAAALIFRGIIGENTNGKTIAHNTVRE